MPETAFGWNDAAHVRQRGTFSDSKLTKDDGTVMAVAVDVRWTAWGNYDCGKNSGFVTPGQIVLNVTTKNRAFTSATRSVTDLTHPEYTYLRDATSGGCVQQINYT